MLLVILIEENLLERFIKEFKKKSTRDWSWKINHRFNKVVEPFVNWKGYDNSFNSWGGKKDIVT